VRILRALAIAAALVMATVGTWQHTASAATQPAASPSAATDGNGNRYVFWENTSGGLEEALYHDGSWSDPSTVVNSSGDGMGPLGSAPSVTVSPTLDSGDYHYQYVFWEGENGDLYEAWWNGKWNGPTDLGDGPLGSAPTAGTDSQGHQYVFWENTGGGLEEVWYNGSSWSSPNTIVSSSTGDGMGPMGSAPTVAVSPVLNTSAGDGYQYVFWEGENGDLYEAWYNGSWNGPINLGAGPLGSAPSAAADYSGNEYVFWVNTSGGLEEDWYNGSWSGPQTIVNSSTGDGMGPLDSVPATSVDLTGEQYIYWEGTDSDLWEAVYDNEDWSGPTNLGDGPLS
jgi:hypothetical protein